MHAGKLIPSSALVVFSCSHIQAATPEWIRELGTNNRDVSNAVSADGLGSVYITGFTEDNLATSNRGGWDAFLSKYDVGGTGRLHARRALTRAGRCNVGAGP